jgi:hypothetical protein
MTPQHFKEILESICLSTHSTKRAIADYLFIHEMTLWKYQQYGVPASKKYLLMDKLREYLFSNLGGCEN